MATIRVLLIEDNRLLRDGATAILNEEADIKAVSVSGTNGDALAKARALKPHVVLLDLGLRNTNSVRIVQSIRKEFPKTEVIVMDLIPAHADVAEFVKEGVSGFISKDATLEDFLKTIRSVAKGIKVLPPPLTGSLFSQIVEHALKTGDPKKIVKVGSDDQTRTGSDRSDREGAEQQTDRREAVYRCSYGEKPRPQHTRETRPPYTARARPPYVQ